MELTLKNIRWECENNPELYGKKISDRTWQKWQRKIILTKSKGDYLSQTSIVGKETAIMFFSLARYRRLHPKTNIKWKQVKEYSKDLGGSSSLSREKYEITCCDLPNIIKSSLNIKLSERTLYRWANQHGLTYSRNFPITDTDIKAWLNVVKIQRNIF